MNSHYVSSADYLKARNLSRGSFPTKERSSERMLGPGRSPLLLYGFFTEDLVLRESGSRFFLLGNQTELQSDFCGELPDSFHIFCQRGYGIVTDLHFKILVFYAALFF